MKSLLRILALILGAAPLLAQATIIGIGDFISPTLIDFESAPSSLINGFYSSSGVTMVNISGGQVYVTNVDPASRTNGMVRPAPPTSPKRAQ